MGGDPDLLALCLSMQAVLRCPALLVAPSLHLIHRAQELYWMVDLLAEQELFGKGIDNAGEGLAASTARRPPRKLAAVERAQAVAVRRVVSQVLQQWPQV